VAQVKGHIASKVARNDRLKLGVLVDWRPALCGDHGNSPAYAFTTRGP
jgi:hypothetical protein